METRIIETVDDWGPIAENILTEANANDDKATILSLTGDLGSGKTTLVQTLAQKLGVKEPVTSPTFTLIKQYEVEHPKFNYLIHMDAYRIESETELAPLQFDFLLQKPKTLFCIEWAENIKSALPKDIFRFKLEINQENKHTIQKVS